MTQTEKITQAITNFVAGGDNSDFLLLDKVLLQSYQQWIYGSSGRYNH